MAQPRTTAAAGQAAEQVLAELDACTAMPFGIARSAAVEELVLRADQLGDEHLAIQARLRLLTAYCYGGEPLKRFPVFNWLLRSYDASRELFDEDAEYRLLWMFKWVTVGAVEHPAVDLDRIMSGLDEMTERFAAAGEGMAPVLSCRFQVLARVQGHELAEDAYQAWVAAPRTPLSDCQTCEPAHRVWHLAAIGADAEALRHAFPVLDHGGCADQPQRMIGHALEPLVRLGMSERAAREHLRGVRLLRERPGSTSTWAQHVLLCARTGRLHRGLDLLEHRLHEVDDAPSPEDAMWLAAAGARLLRGLEEAGEGDLPVREYAIGDGGLQEYPAGELRVRLARRALELADRFDRRNRSSTVGTEVARWLDASTLPDLPIDRVLTRPRDRPDHPGARAAPADAWRVAAERPPIRPNASAAGSFVATGDHTGPMDLRLIGSAPTELARALLAAEWTGSPQQRSAVLAHWQAVRAVAVSGVAGRDAAGRDATGRDAASRDAADRGPAGGDTSDPEAVAVARLDAALALDQAGRGKLSAQQAREAAVRLNEFGAVGPALRHALACVRLEFDRGGDTAEVLADAAALVREGARLAAPGDQICLQLGLAALLRAAAARSVQSPPSPGAAEPELSGPALAAVRAGLVAAAQVPSAELDPDQRAAVALLRRDRAMTLPLPDRVAELEAALQLLPAGHQSRERALVGYALGTSLAEAGDPGGAVQVLAASADDALAAADAELAVHTQHALGRALADAGDPAGAVQALSRATELSGPRAGALLLAELRQGLAAALRDSGDVVEAAELADGALDELEDALEGWGIRPPGERADRAEAAGADAAVADVAGGEVAGGDVAGGDVADRATAPGPSGAAAEPAGGSVAADLPGGSAAAARVAADLAFTAAQCAQTLGETDLAADLARRAASWAEGRPDAQAEAMVLAAQCTRHVPEAADLHARAARLFAAAGRWWDAAACRRARALSVLDHRGLEEALAALDQAADELSRTVVPEEEQVRLAWEALALTEQRLRIQAGAGQLAPALAGSAELADAFRELGDGGSAREVIGLRARMLDELGRTAEAVPELSAAAEEALAAGDQRQAARLGGYLSAFLDELGLPDEAAAVWARFAPADGPAPGA